MTELGKAMLFCLGCTLMAFTTATSTSGCRSSRASASASVSMPAVQVLAANTLQERAAKAYKNTHKSIYARIKGVSESDQMGNLDFSGNIYWEKDKQIWVTLRKFGFEGMRVRITPDSCIVLNRLEKTAMMRDASWLEAQYGISDGFAMLQSMLMNEAYVVKGAERSAAIKDSMHLLTQRTGDRLLRCQFTEGDYRLQRVEVQELRQQISLTSEFLDWTEAGSRGFSSRHRVFDVASPTDGKMHLDLKFDEVEFDKAREVKFEVPEHYRRE